MENQVVYICMLEREVPKAIKQGKQNWFFKVLPSVLWEHLTCCCKGMPIDSMGLMAVVFKGEKQRRQEQKNNEDQSLEKCERKPDM